MTTQEQQLIDGLVQRVNSTSLPDKDLDAEQRLRSGLGANQNALYILAQTVLVQQYALDQAKQQIDSTRAELERLRQQASAAPPPPQKHTGFLESIFGSGDHTPPQQPAAPPSQGYSPVQNYPPPAQPAYAPQQSSYAPPQSYSAPIGGGGGFLRGAAQTAAGVAAGALAFEGVESLMHGFGGGGGFGGAAPREEIINNYYDQPGDRNSGDTNQSRGFDDNNPGDTNPGDNVFTDANDAGSDDAGTYNDQDDSGNDDSGVSDDLGGFDDTTGNDDSF